MTDGPAIEKPEPASPASPTKTGEEHGTWRQPAREPHPRRQSVSATSVQDLPAPDQNDDNI
jgi:hypothetical protein